MFRMKRTVLSLVLLAGLVLSACTTPTPQIVTVEVTKEVTREVTVEKLVTPTSAPEPEAEPAGPKTLVICMGQEPDSMYWYGGSMLASRHVQHAIYDGAIDSRSFSFQPIILEELPTFENGGAQLNAVTVQEGDLVVNDGGDPVELTPGTRVRPAGCRSTDCAIEFDGTPLEMDQIEAAFTMLSGLQWSDGAPLTADDSVYSFEVQADADTPATHYLPERTASYVASDDVTAIWTGLPGYLDSTYYINFAQPLPRHLWQDELGYTALDLVTAEESSRMPLGWGAFMMTEWVSGDHITVERNPLYFRAAEGLPKVDTVIFRFVADSNAVIAQLISGECDIATQDGALEDQAQILVELEEQGVLVPVFATGTSLEHLDFGIDPVDEYERPDFFEDVRVRQAISFCLDRQSVIDTILYGRSVIPLAFSPSEHPLYPGDAALPSYAFDPEAGMALLEEAGWSDTDGDGVREAHGVAGIPDGTVFEVTWASTTATMRVQYMQIYQQHLAACGLKVNLENIPATQYFADGPDGPIFGRRFDLCSYTTSTGVEPPCNLWGSWEIPNEVNGWGASNNPGFSNAEYDAACKRGLQALPGTDDYVQGYQDSMRLFGEMVPSLPLFLRLKIAAYAPVVQGFVVDPTENSEMWNIEELDLVAP